MVSAQTPISRRIASGQARRGSAREGTNVGAVERWMSLVGGGLLAFDGLRRGTLGGVAEAVLGGSILYRGMTGHCHLYAALGVNTAQHYKTAAVSARRGVKVVQAVTIRKPADELFRFWRDFENLPRFMRHLESVTCEDGRSHWVARGPAGMNVSWDAEIINEEPNRLIAWRSLEGSQVSTAGSVHFTPAPGDRGTEVRVVLKYDPPGGKLGSWLAWLFGADPECEIQEELRRFKQLTEAGDIPTVKGQTSCRGR
ncbi:MAG: SRPBCC family protein [Planctomycetes bacterium]|nr:SRPBCC family protein [Planctomycetota bacterium]